MTETMEQKNARNARVSARWDELRAGGVRGHYETLFRVVREELERATEAPARWEYSFRKTTPGNEAGAVLNEAGQEGWELCAIDYGCFIFKRPAP